MARALLILISLMVITAYFATADEVTLNPVADAYVFMVNPDTNYGSSPVLYIGENSDDQSLWSLLKFDIGSIPSGATINWGQISIWCNSRYGTVPPPPYDHISCDCDIDDWNEMSVTWNTAPQPLGEIVNGDWPTSSAWLVFEITDQVQDWVDGVTPNHGALVFTLLDVPGYCYCNMGSRENSDNNKRPKLYVTYTPSAVESSSLGKTKAAFK